MSYFPAFSCVALMKIYSKPYSVLICNNYKCYKLYRIYLYNFTQVRSSYAWKSHKYYIHHSNIIILGTRESEKKIRGELRLEFFRGKIPSSEASSFPDIRANYSRLTLFVTFQVGYLCCKKESWSTKGSIPKRKCPKLWKKSIIFLTPPP